MLSDCIYIQRTMNIGHRILFIDLKYLMNKTLLTGLLCCTLTVQSFADQPLEGFTYATSVSYTHLTLPTSDLV